MHSGRSVSVFVCMWKGVGHEVQGWREHMSNGCKECVATSQGNLTPT